MRKLPKTSGKAAPHNSAVGTPSPHEKSTLAALLANGRLPEAATLAETMTVRFPQHAFGWKMLGVIFKQMGWNADALASMQKAAELSPGDAGVHYNMGIILQDVCRLSEAEASYRRALQIKPDYAEAHSNLGNTLKHLGRLDEAESCYRQALQIRPDYVEAHYNLGIALQDMSRLAEAETCYRRAMEFMPNFFEARINLGNILKDIGRLDEAEACYRQALQIRPDYAEVHYNLGITLQYLDRLGEAETCYRQALQIKPDYAEAYNNLGNTLKGAGHMGEAETCYRQALQIKPDYAEAHSNLGNILKDTDRLVEAETCYRRALQIKPDYAEAHYNLGNILKDLGMFDDAVESYRRALQVKPDSVEAHYNLGNVLNDFGPLDDAVESYRMALQIKPDDIGAHNNLLFALNYHPDLSAEEIYRAYQEYDALRGIPLRSTWQAHSNDKAPDRRLRVGYVSPDFRHHATRLFLEPLLAHHDKTRVEVYAYAELAKEDGTTARYKGYVEHWIPTKDMSDETLAECIRSDGIDILVELAGHTVNNRLPVFARKPAPVSVSWLGYGYTTGLSAIDYYLTDEASAPPSSEELFAEQPWRIATPAYVYRPADGMSDVSSLPAQQRGYITFGTLTRSVRINHRTIRAWAEILKAVPNSRLVIDSHNFKSPAMQERMAARFAEHGIHRDRLEIGYHSPPWDVLRGIDIGLDCFPHNSGTTLFETLYMGIPYITLAGRPSVGRLGSSILQGMGHPEWIAESEDEYVAKAVGLACDIVRLSELRATLRDQMKNSSLMDEEGFARKVEDAYRKMWQRYITCAD